MNNKDHLVGRLTRGTPALVEELITTLADMRCERGEGGARVSK